MKKLLALLLALVLCFAFVACGDDTSYEGDTSYEEGSSDEPTVSDYIEANYEGLLGVHDVESEGMTQEIVEDDGSLVFKLTFIDQLPDPEATRPLIEETMSANSSIYHSNFESLKNLIPSAKSIIIAYYNADGELIVYAEYAGVAAAYGDESVTTIEAFIEYNREYFLSSRSPEEAAIVDVDFFEIDNYLVYQFTFINELSDNNAMIETVETPDPSVTQYYQGLLESLRVYVPEAEGIAIEYFTNTGEFLTAVEYN